MVSAYIRALPPDDWLIMRRLVGRELVWPNTDLENVGHTDSAPMTNVCSTY